MNNIINISIIILPIKDESRQPNFYGTLILKDTPKGASVVFACGEGAGCGR